ncbi:MAG: HD-GYP domain-containing protein [Dehalococcoidia bacterium]
MIRRWPIPNRPEAIAALVAALAVFALGAAGPEFQSGWTGGRAASVVLVFVPFVVSLAVAVVAWDADEWSPAFLAAGCIAMAAAPIAMGSDAFASLGAVPSDPGTTFAVAMTLGAVCYTLAVVPLPLAASRRKNGPRFLAVGMVVAVAAALAVRQFALSEVPALPLPHVVEAIGAGLYILSGARFEAVYRLARLPFQALVAAGCYGFAAVFALAAVLPGAPIVAIIAVMFAACPVLALLGEQRSRRGFRSVVLALFLPGALASLRRSYPEPMRRLLAQIAGADPALRGHLDRVGDLSARLSWELDCSPEEVRTALTAAQLHDIGKLYLPRALLDKPGALSPGERQVIETHVEQGAELAQRLGYPADVCAAIRQHHERWDGTGYPAALDQAGIDRIASVVAVADTYDALVSDRPYKRAWTRDEAMAEIDQQAGSHFAPEVVVALRRAVAPAEPIPIRGRVKRQRAA